MKRRLSYANVVATLALFLALGGGSYAAITSGFSSGGLLRACVSSRSGTMRLVKRARDCRHGEVLISWNVQGKPGSPGLPGTPGLPGATGRQGPPGPATGPAGGDLSGTYPNPTVTSIGGHTPITNATAAGGVLTGTFPNPQIAVGAVGPSDLSSSAAYCSATTAFSLTPTGFCSGPMSSFSGLIPATGVYCLDLPIAPSGGAVSIDSAAPGFPVAFMSLSTTTIQGACGSGYNVLVTTYAAAGGSAANEAWYGFFY